LRRARQVGRAASGRVAEAALGSDDACGRRTGACAGARWRVEHDGSVSASVSVLVATARQHNRKRNNGASKTRRHVPSFEREGRGVRLVTDWGRNSAGSQRGCECDVRKRRSQRISMTGAARSARSSCLANASRAGRDCVGQLTLY
jgi:hypothetical protein